VNGSDTLQLTRLLYAVNGVDTLLLNTVVKCCEWDCNANAKHVCYVVNGFHTLLLNTVIIRCEWV
jgi:hypothetical protein